MICLFQRLLLRKMLSIDLKPVKNVIGQTGAHREEVSIAPKSSSNLVHHVNSCKSLNVVARIREKERVADNNKSILNKL